MKEKAKILGLLAVIAASAVVIVNNAKILTQDSQLARVNRGGSSNCVRTAPTLTLAPTAQSGYVNQPVAYNVTLTNNDSGDCGSSQFFTYTFPDGRPGSQMYGSGGYYAVNAGQTISFTTTLTPPTGTPAGDQRFGYAAGNQSSSQWGYSNIATHTIVSPSADTVAPSQPAVTLYGFADTTAFIGWTPSSDNLGVAGYKIVLNGQEVTRLDSNARSYNYLPGLAPNTAYTLGVAAYDYALNESTVGSVSFTTRATADTTAPSKPANLRLINATSTSATLAWDPVTDDTAVWNYWVFDGSRNTVCIVDYPSSSCTAENLSPNTRYTLKMFANDIAGNRSPESGQLRFTTPR